MKIIYVENVRIPSERAHAYQIVQTCSWLARFGHDVTLVNPKRTSSGLNVPFKHVLLPCVDALSWTFFPSKKLAYVIQRASFIRMLKRWAEKRRADVWYTRDPAMVQALADGKKTLALELHDDPASNLERWHFIKTHVALFIAITNGLKERLVELGIPADRVVVAPDGYDPRDFESLPEKEAARKVYELPEQAFIALYAGSLYPWKGVELAVSAWNKTDVNAYLVIAGGPSGDRERLMSLVPKEASDRVCFIRRLPHAELVKLLPAADIALLTTSPDWEIGRRYTSPIKQFEYLAAGLPILASDVPSSHEALEESVAKFYEPTGEAFVEKLRRMMQDHSWRRSASDAAKHLVKNHTWEARSKRISEALKEYE